MIKRKKTIKKRPPRILLEGDIEAAKGYLGIAKSSANVLFHNTKLRGIHNNVRRMSLPGGVKINCWQNFSNPTIKIYVPSSSEEPTDILLIILFKLWDVDREEYQYLFYQMDATGGSVFAAASVVDENGDALSQPFYVSDTVHDYVHEIVAANGLTEFNTTGGTGLNVEATESTDNSSGTEYDVGEAGDPPCEESGSVDRYIWDYNRLEVDYAISGGGFSETLEGYDRTTKDTWGQQNWYDDCGNEMCTFCYRLLGSFDCGSHEEARRKKTLLTKSGWVLGVALWDAPGYERLWLETGYDTTDCACYYDDSIYSDGKTHYIKATANWLDGSSEEVTSISETGGGGVDLGVHGRQLGTLKYSDDGEQRVVVREKLLVQETLDGGNLPWEISWQARLRLYWSGDSPAGFAELTEVDEETVYALFGTTRAQYLAGLTRTFTGALEWEAFEENADNFGLDIENVYEK